MTERNDDLVNLTGHTLLLFPGPGVNDRGRTVGCRGLRKLATR